MWFFKSKSKKKQIDKDIIPNHIAFIMDGNGRWAKKRGMPRNFGHKKGVDAVKRVQQACSKFGVKAVSFFVFSTTGMSGSLPVLPVQYPYPAKCLRLS